MIFHAVSTPQGSRPNNSPLQCRTFYLHFLANEVYRDAYAQADATTTEWAAEKPGWGAARKNLIAQMLEKRAALGWELPENRSTLRFGEGGFEFTGSPKTPPYHLTIGES